MVSVWWVLLAFLGGGFAGILLMALLFMAGEEPEHSTRAPDLAQ